MVDIDALSAFNPWWTSRKVDKILLGKYQRLFLRQLKKYLPKRQILLIYGLRRVGKTTLFYQLIQELLNKKIPSLNILYFSFDEKAATIEEITRVYEQKVLKKGLTGAKNAYFFFDEIQKLDDWQNKIKILYDRYPNIKLFLSGSASVSLQKKSQESLAGRIFDFFLKPLDFAEFLEWKRIKVEKANLELYKAQLIPAFLDYLRKGGFPEIVEEEDEQIIKNYVKNTVLERIIYRDLPLEFGLKDVELLRILVEMIIIEPGMIINFDRLARDLGRNKMTIINYFDYLKYSLLIREIKNLRPGFLVSSRKRKKAYPANSSFCFALRDDFYKEEVLQKIAEVVVINALEGKFYFRNSFEVDLVLKRNAHLLPIEVKYGQVEKKSILRFLEKFALNHGIIVTKDIYQKEKNLHLIPLWRFLLEKNWNK